MNYDKNLLTRRQILRSAGLMAGAVALAACDTAPNSAGGGPDAPQASGGAGGGSTGGSGALTWWDHFNPLKGLHEETFARFAEDGGPKVDYTVYNPNEQGQALQLAFSSEQLPDVYTLAGVGVSPSTLVQQGWFTPLTNADAIRGAQPEGSIIPGLHVFGDKLYTFSIFTFRQYESLLWFNRGMLEEAGLDPDNPPASWDDVRAAAKSVKDSGSAGLILPLQFQPRMETFVYELAQTAGFPGSRLGGTDGVDLATGEYHFHHDSVVEAIEFLLSFQQDDLLFPSSSSLDARAGRARWAANGSAFFLDGPWNAGVVSGDFEAFLPQLGVGQIPTPDGSTPVLTRPPAGGTFWVSGQTDQAEQASALLELFVDADYQRGLAEAMDQPPLDPTAVADSDAHDTYKHAVEMFAEQVFLGPTPHARNPLIPEVEAAMKPIEPGLGAIVQGAFSGQVDDVRAALQQLSDQKSKERDAAIKQVGGDVSVDDWAFPDWTAGEDYGPERYTA